VYAGRKKKRKKEGGRRHQEGTHKIVNIPKRAMNLDYIPRCFKLNYFKIL
jgi:hypothetical protein